MDKKEAEEDLPHVFTFNVVLTHSSTYYRWRHIGVAQQLATDEEIASFLMDHYDKVTGVPSGCGVCATCQSPLRLSCVNCGVVKSEPSAVSTADSSGESTLDDNATCNEDGEMLQEDNDGSEMDGTLKISPTHRRDGGECPQALSSQQTHDDSEETFKEEPMLEQDTEAQRTDPAVQRQFVSKGAGRRNNSDAGFHRRKASSFSPGRRGREITKQPDEEQAGAPPSPPSGRRRRQKRPEVSLTCVVCGKKLSSRASVLNHMASKHPTAELPAALAPLASRNAAKTKPGARRGRNKKLKPSGSTVDPEGGSTLFLAAGGGEPGAESEPSREDGASLEKLKRRKAELESLVCETCGTTFEHKKQMYNHRRHCTWKVCHLCGKSVKLLEMHLKRHNSPGQFSCSRCPKTFRDRHHLNQHMLYHNGERPFCCEVCGMRYHERTRLNTHLRTHSGTKPFKCTQCDAAFTRMRGLNDHMRVHTGEKPYGCQVCGRQFSSSGNLAAHRRKVHRMEPLTPNHMTRKLYIEPSNVARVPSADVSVGAANVGLVGPADVSVGAANVGLGPADVSVGAANMGLGPADVSVGAANVGLGPR